MRILEAALSFATVCLPATAQHIDGTIPRQGDSELLDVELVGDVDADGTRDIALVERWYTVGPQHLRIVSGQTGRRIWRVLDVRSGRESGWLRVANAGDLDGDGHDEVLAGNPRNRFDRNAGSALVFSGADGSVLRTIGPPLGGTEPTFGFGVAGIGDVDGDGTPDVAVSSHPGTIPGSVWVFSGRTGAVLRTIDGATIGSGFHIGYTLAAAGDVNGDGTPDLATSAFIAPKQVFVFSGLDGSEVLRLPPPQTFPDTSFGHALVGVGDLDGDGRDDLAIGDPSVDGTAPFQYRGAVYVYGLDATGSPELKLQIQGVADLQALGGSVAALGDIDGDGIGDLAASSGIYPVPGGAYRHSFVLSGRPHGPTKQATVLLTIPNLAEASIVLGPTDVDGDGLGEVLWTTTGSSATELRYYGTTPVRNVWRVRHPDPDREVGTAIDRIGDVNGDGVDDLAVSAASNRAGVTDRVLLVDGTDGSILRILDELAAGTGFGSDVAGLPDADGDGFGDVAVGTPGDDQNGNDAGAVHVFSGSTGALLFSHFGDNPGDGFGGAVCSAGDFDADGTSDVAASASAAAIPGYVRVFRGRDGLALHRVDGLVAGTSFGAAIAGGIDLDVDGFDDLLVSEPGWSQDNSGPGRVLAVSGRTHAILQQSSGLSSFPLSGFVEAAGDVNGDLRDDFVISGPVPRIEYGGGGYVTGSFRSTLSPALDAASGDFDGDGLVDIAATLDAATDVIGWSMGNRMTFQSVPPTTGDSFLGARITGIGDVDGDGFDEIALARGADDSLWVFRPSATGTPATGRSFGVGCPGSNGALPRIDVRTRPFLGARMRLDLRGAAALSAVAVNLGPRMQADLTPLGLPGCTLLAGSALATLDASTTAFGTATSEADVPVDTALVGAAFAAQWVCLDPAANTVGAILSDGAQLVIGSR